MFRPRRVGKCLPRSPTQGRTWKWQSRAPPPLPKRPGVSRTKTGTSKHLFFLSFCLLSPPLPSPPRTSLQLLKSRSDSGLFFLRACSPSSPNRLHFSPFLLLFLLRREHRKERKRVATTVSTRAQHLCSFLPRLSPTALTAN